MNRPVWLGGHGRWERRLHGYVDESLKGGERAAFERHFAGCAACSAGVEELRATRLLLRAMPERPAPRSFHLTPEMAAEAKTAGKKQVSGPAVVRAPIRPPVPGLALRFAQVTAAVAALGFGALLAVDLGGLGSGGSDFAAGDDDDSEIGTTMSASEQAPKAADTDADAGDVSRQTSGGVESSTTIPLPSPESGGVDGAAAPSATGTALAPNATPVPPKTGSDSATTGTPGTANDTIAPATSGDSLYGEGQSTAGAYSDAGNPETFDAPVARTSDDDGGKTTIRSFEAVLASVAIGAGALAFFARKGARSRT